MVDLIKEICFFIQFNCIYVIFYRCIYIVFVFIYVVRKYFLKIFLYLLSRLVFVFWIIIESVFYFRYNFLKVLGMFFCSVLFFFKLNEFGFFRKCWSLYKRCCVCVCFLLEESGGEMLFLIYRRVLKFFTSYSVFVFYSWVFQEGFFQSSIVFW